MLSFADTFHDGTHGAVEITPAIIAKLVHNRFYRCSDRMDGGWGTFTFKKQPDGLHRFDGMLTENCNVNFILMRTYYIMGSHPHVYDVEGNLCDVRIAQVSTSKKLWAKLIGAWAPVNVTILCCVMRGDPDFDLTVRCTYAGTSKFYANMHDDVMRIGREVMQKRLTTILRRWVDKDSAGMIVAMAMQ